MDDTTIGVNTTSAQSTPVSGVFGGLIPVANAMATVESDRDKTDKQNAEPVIQGLAGHVVKCFEAAKQDKLLVEQRMLSNLRARQGQYDPDTLAKIRQTGGSEVFMMLSSAKARAAIAWIRDVLMGNGDEKPWTVSPTKIPEMPVEAVQNAIARAAEMVEQLHMLYGGPQNVPESMVEELLELARSREQVESVNLAKRSMARMEARMEDQMQEGGFSQALYEFSDDISTFPSAILKGPVVRNKPSMSWSETGELVVEDKIALEWERVSPFDAYPSPGASDVNDGYFIQLHHLYPSDLEALIDVDGYSGEAIRTVIATYGTTGHKENTPIDSTRADAEGKPTSSVSDTTSPTIDAVQFWGPVLGKHLVEWGINKDTVKDMTKTYHCEVWVVGSYVIRAVLNYDPLGRRPYYKASWEEVPGAFWGNSPVDLIADCQTMCNNAARSLANNIAVSSGPQVDVNIDRIPAGEDVTSIYPWKVWQTQTDPYGNSAPPVNFFQPQSNANELMFIYEKFSQIADEVSGIPRYLTGDSAPGGAGRTASGLSMMLQNAGKSIKSVVATIDKKVIGPAVERLFYYNMKYGTDPELKRTDVKVVARGAQSLVVKEQAQVRRNEFLNVCLSSPVVAQVIGEEAIADLLRSMAAGLDMDVDKIIPPAEVIKARMFAAKQEQIQAQMLAAQMGQAPAEAAGTQPGPQIMPGQENRQLPEGGGQTVNNFTPARA